MAPQPLPLRSEELPEWDRRLWRVVVPTSAPKFDEHVAGVRSDIEDRLILRELGRRLSNPWD